MKKIALTLLPYYKESMERISKMDSMSDAYEYAVERYIQFGICYCAEMAFYLDIYTEKWVENRAVYEEGGRGVKYWGPTVYRSTTLEGLKEAIQARIDMLEKITKIKQPA